MAQVVVFLFVFLSVVWKLNFYIPSFKVVTLFNLTYQSNIHEYQHPSLLFAAFYSKQNCGLLVTMVLSTKISKRKTPRLTWKNTVVEKMKIMARILPGFNINHCVHKPALHIYEQQDYCRQKRWSVTRSSASRGGLERKHLFSSLLSPGR